MSNKKSITTNATNTVFIEFYGGGNGGTNLLRVRMSDAGAGIDAPGNNDAGHAIWNRPSTGNGQGNEHYGGYFDDFTPFSYDAAKGYQAEYEFEMLPRTSGNSLVITRSYYHWASFARTTVAPVTNTITDCTFKGNFYGGGNLGAVDGAGATDNEYFAVTSTLQGNTVVKGSVFGAGFSAANPSFPVHDKSTVKYAYRDFAGFIHDGSLDYNKYTAAVGNHHVGDTIYYTWIHDVPTEWGISPAPSTSNPKFQYPSTGGEWHDPSKLGNWYIYTPQELTNLGAVSGNVKVIIKDNTTVGTLVGGQLKEGTGNVYGGGDESAVIVAVDDRDNPIENTGNTTVILQGSAQVLGNVYGGGNNGPVQGDSKVNIQDTP